MIFVIKPTVLIVVSMMITLQHDDRMQAPTFTVRSLMFLDNGSVVLQTDLTIKKR